MSKKAILACLLAVMMLLTSCSLVVKDEAVDAAQVIVRVGDKTHTKAEVNQLTAEYLESERQYYAQYGYNFDVKDASAVAEAQDAAIQNLIQQDVIEAKIAEMNIVLTEEEQAEIDNEWQNTRELLIMLTGASELPAEEQEVVIANAAAMYGVTKEAMETSAKYDKLKKQAVADVTVTDEEVKADFDAKVEANKASFTANVSAYGDAVNSGETVYYRPAGYRMVKAILLQVDTAAADELTAKATTQKNLADAKEEQIKKLDNAADLDLETLAAAVEVTVVGAEQVATATDLVATPTDLTAVVTDTLPDIDAEVAQMVRDYKTAKTLQAAYEEQAAAAKEAAWAAAEARADAVLAELAAGADWDETMKAKTDDPGMQEGSATAETGYALCAGYTSFTSAYVEGAMALTNVGDVSGKVKDDRYGFFIIKYVSDVTEGAVELADVQQAIHDDLLKTRQDETFTATMDQWVKDAGAKINKKPLAD